MEMFGVLNNHANITSTQSVEFYINKINNIFLRIKLVEFSFKTCLKNQTNPVKVHLKSVFRHVPKHRAFVSPADMLSNALWELSGGGQGGHAPRLVSVCAP